MKFIDEGRFQKKKPEAIAFRPAPIPTQATPHTERTSERSDERTNVPEHEGPSYTLPIEIPPKRLKTRQSFDIFDDQYHALKKLQIAEYEHSGEKVPKLGEMVQEALDSYIREKAKKLLNRPLSKGK